MRLYNHDKGNRVNIDRWVAVNYFSQIRGDRFLCGTCNIMGENT